MDNIRDITKTIQNYKVYNNNMHGAQKPPLDFLKAAGAQCLSSLSGLNFALKDEINLTALKSEQLPQYLASLGLNPYQMTSVIYGIFREVRLLGTLTPESDNAIHLDKEKILKMAKDPALEASIYSLFLKVQQTKNWDCLFQKESKKTPLAVPDLRHNPSMGPVLTRKETPAADTIEILDFVKFLSACGIDPLIVKKAAEERMLLSSGHTARMGGGSLPVRQAGAFGGKGEKV